MIKIPYFKKVVDLVKSEFFTVLWTSRVYIYIYIHLEQHAAVQPQIHLRSYEAMDDEWNEWTVICIVGSGRPKVPNSADF